MPNFVFDGALPSGTSVHRLLRREAIKHPLRSRLDGYRPPNALSFHKLRRRAAAHSGTLYSTATGHQAPFLQPPFRPMVAKHPVCGVLDGDEPSSIPPNGATRREDAMFHPMQPERFWTSFATSLAGRRRSDAAKGATWLRMGCVSGMMVDKCGHDLSPETR